MIKLRVNNGGIIRMCQQNVDGVIDGVIDVDTLYGEEVENSITMPPEDMVMLLNYYRFQKRNGKEIF